jgi:metallophosphoesterase superfamily enzyme
MSQTIIFVGDLHLKSQSPICRRDAFPIAILNKIEYIASLARSYNCKTIMLLGDVFDSPVTTLPYLASVINTFKKVQF